MEIGDAIALKRLLYFEQALRDAAASAPAAGASTELARLADDFHRRAVRLRVRIAARENEYTGA
jgi:hypothetical protein